MTREVDFASEYPRLEPAQQERFRGVVTRLLSGQVLTPGTALRPDPDWRFAERHRELLDAYLRIGGWRLDADLGLRLCRAVHESGEQRVRLGKLESLVLCTLRLVYHEQMQRMSEEGRCELRVGDLRERLIQSGRPAGQLSRRVLADAVRRLARHSLVGVERGNEVLLGPVHDLAHLRDQAGPVPLAFPHTRLRRLPSNLGRPEAATAS